MIITAVLSRAVCELVNNLRESMQTETVQIGVSKQYCLFLLLYDK